MGKERGSTTKEGRSKGRELSEDRNIPTIKVDIPMPKGAKPPRNSDTGGRPGTEIRCGC